MRRFRLEALIPQVSTKRTVFLGEGALRYRQTLERLGDRAIFGHLRHMVPSPAAVALLCRKKASRGDCRKPTSPSSPSTSGGPRPRIKASGKQ
ncbi:MAG: hypothetical protein MZV70_44950 [Desulfobacterales bacterium]|nr:hypothetical protein [Desulfobacterales bacterium]